MCRLVETIQIKDGFAVNLKYHEERFNRTRRELFGINEDLSLEQIIVQPDETHEAIQKCRVIYSSAVHEVQFSPYTFKNITSLKLVEDDLIVYGYKYLDRSGLDALFSGRESCSDVIIVKNGLVSDASSSNIAFFNGSQWHTPAEPLLCGTCRARLIDEKKIIEKQISPSGLRDYLYCSLFNAMRDLGEIIIPVSEIY